MRPLTRRQRGVVENLRATPVDFTPDPAWDEILSRLKELERNCFGKPQQ